MIPQITSGTCHARIAPKIMLPPTTKARRRLPRRQTVIVASTKKISSNTRLTELSSPHGFATPIGTEMVSPPHENWWSLAICRKLRFGVKTKLRINTTVRRPQMLHASHTRPACR
ncbi:MAG: hypothetical protein Udaeo2_34510 [Candidatus Udaeobacter sp.]|nr:MAG: hypothetical protein Udaeo2_34510 [Candidatus Udaeobacter sp.]